MNQRLTPQAELESYFGNLLEELEQEGEPPVLAQITLRQESEDKVSTKLTADAPAIQTDTLPAETLTNNSGEEPSSPEKKPSSSEKKASSPEKITSSPEKMPSVILATHPSPKTSPKTKSAPEAKHDAESAPVEDLQTLQRAQLQRMLNNLLPTTGEAPVEQVAELISIDNENLIIDEALAMTEGGQHSWEPLSDEWLDNNRPVWAQQPFEVLLVKVAGIQLGLPLASLDGIYPLENNLTPLFGQAPWFMGLQKSIRGNIKTINSVQFFMSERCAEQQADGFQYNIAINDSGWGLAVDSIEQPVTFDPEDLKWRVNHAKRPWMAGIIKEYTCILLDVPALSRLLSDQNSGLFQSNNWQRSQD